MTKLDDWNKCNELYCGWMYYEAAERGYDARAAGAAQHEYIKARMAYQEKYGEPFNPSADPKTSILEDAAELSDLSALLASNIAANQVEAKAYSQKVSDWLDGCRDRARATRKSEGA